MYKSDYLNYSLIIAGVGLRGSQTLLFVVNKETKKIINAIDLPYYHSKTTDGEARFLNSEDIDNSVFMKNFNSYRCLSTLTINKNVFTANSLGHKLYLSKSEEITEIYKEVEVDSFGSINIIQSTIDTFYLSWRGDVNNTVLQYLKDRPYMN